MILCHYKYQLVCNSSLLDEESKKLWKVLGKKNTENVSFIITENVSFIISQASEFSQTLFLHKYRCVLKMTWKDNDIFILVYFKVVFLKH